MVEHGIQKVGAVKYICTRTSRWDNIITYIEGDIYWIVFEEQLDQRGLVKYSEYIIKRREEQINLILDEL